MDSDTAYLLGQIFFLSRKANGDALERLARDPEFAYRDQARLIQALRVSLDDDSVAVAESFPHTSKRLDVHQEGGEESG